MGTFLTLCNVYTERAHLRVILLLAAGDRHGRLAIMVAPGGGAGQHRDTARLTYASNAKAFPGRAHRVSGAVLRTLMPGVSVTDGLHSVMHPNASC